MRRVLVEPVRDVPAHGEHLAVAAALQVRDGAAILGFLMPIFADLMMDNPDKDWGKPFYPVVP